MSTQATYECIALNALYLQCIDEKFLAKLIKESMRKRFSAEPGTYK